MGDLQEGDQVYCADGQWHDIEILDVHIPESMYEIKFTKGDEKNGSKDGLENNNICSNYYSVKCSGDHLWTLYNDLNLPIILRAKDIYSNIETLKNHKVGNIDDKIKIYSIEEIDPIPSRCIHIKDLIEDENNQLLFEILAENENGDYIPVFTHNCMERLICGQLGSVASRMALDDNQATTIDGKHKGAGMIKAQGIVSNVQYYFENQKWLNQWFKDRGMTEKGWDPNDLDNPEQENIDLGEDEEFSIKEDKTVISFNGTTREIENSKDQKFKEI